MTFFFSELLNFGHIQRSPNGCPLMVGRKPFKGFPEHPFNALTLTKIEKLSERKNKHMKRFTEDRLDINQSVIREQLIIKLLRITGPSHIKMFVFM